MANEGMHPAAARGAAAGDAQSRYPRTRPRIESARISRHGSASCRVVLRHPIYRDYLADLIESRYGSRYRFCKKTGVDPGQPSRVLSGRADLPVGSLSRVLDVLQAVLAVESRRALAFLQR